MMVPAAATNGFRSAGWLDAMSDTRPRISTNPPDRLS
jgi:hypothetical protein